MSRRRFLYRLAATSGYGAAYTAMKALGWMPSASAAAVSVPVPSLGRGKRVAILGAGMAGLVSAYELERSGFAVTIFEARARTGGRTWTLRQGSTIEMIGEAAQTVQFSDGGYMDAGPSRIPGDHDRLLAYCRSLNVALEVDVNANRSAYLWAPGANGGKPIALRQAVNDTRGYVAELLAKATDQKALDGALTADERERLLPLLRTYGDLAPDNAFRGTDRSGIEAPSGATDEFRHKTPLRLDDLLRNPELLAIVYDDQLDQQATMLQPIGGMDRIAFALEKAIRGTFRKNTEVSAIHRTSSRVTITARDRRTQATQTQDYDYAVVTLPPNILKDVTSNFANDVVGAIGSFQVDDANKIGFDAPRFWEAEHIYGGISFLAGAAGLIMYPSHGFNQARGVLIGSYSRGAAGRAFAALPLEGQVAVARAAVEHIHPGHGRELSSPAVVNWSKVPFSLSPWTSFGERTREGHIDSPAARLLNAQDGPIYFAGAYLTQLPGWQEGAVWSAHEVVAKIMQRAAAP